MSEINVHSARKPNPVINNDARIFVFLARSNRQIAELSRDNPVEDKILLWRC